MDSVHLPHLTVGRKEQFSHVWSSKIWILPKAATPKYDIPAVVPISKWPLVGLQLHLLFKKLWCCLLKKLVQDQLSASCVFWSKQHKLQHKPWVQSLRSGIRNTCTLRWLMLSQSNPSHLRLIQLSLSLSLHPPSEPFSRETSEAAWSKQSLPRGTSLDLFDWEERRRKHVDASMAKLPTCLCDAEWQLLTRKPGLIRVDAVRHSPVAGLQW